VRFSVAPGQTVVFDARDEVMDRNAAKSGDVLGRGVLPNESSPSRPALTPSALEAVRGATAQSHRSLEAMPGQARLLAADFSRAEYRAALERMYGFYEPLGRALGAQAHARTWGERVAQRTELLRCDLLDIGLSPADVNGLARCARLPEVDTPDRALGCAYVFEGATLGGRVIFKHLTRIFAAPDVPLRFFAGDGARTAESWRRFCDVLNATASNVDEVCAAARAAFDAMAAWLGEPASIGAGKPGA
jgi:heme oxygenase